MEEIAKRDIEDASPELIFLKELVREKMNKRLFPYEAEVLINQKEEIEVRILDPLLNARDLIFLKKLETFFKINYYEYVSKEEKEKRYLIVSMKPKKSIIKLSKALMKMEVL